MENLSDLSELDEWHVITEFEDTDFIAIAYIPRL